MMNHQKLPLPQNSGITEVVAIFLFIEKQAAI